MVFPLFIQDLDYADTPKTIINLKHNHLYRYYKQLESVSSGSIFIDTSNTEPKGFVGSNRVEYFSSSTKPSSDILEQTRGAFDNLIESNNKRKGSNLQEGSNKRRRGGGSSSKIMFVNGFYTMIANHKL